MIVSKDSLIYLCYDLPERQHFMYSNKRATSPVNYSQFFRAYIMNCYLVNATMTGHSRCGKNVTMAIVGSTIIGGKT